MTHVIFLVHGMGVYGTVENGAYKADDDWFDESEKALKEIYDTFIKDDDDLGGDAEFADQFTIERVRFDDLFEQYRQAWEDQAETWGVFSGAFIDTLKTVFDSNSADSFLWTHVLDVLLYELALIRVPIQEKVALQILKGLKKHHVAGALEQWSIIAHSLGTAVMHGAMEKLLGDIDSDPVLAGAVPRQTVMCMAANVTSALEPAAIAYSATLAPGSALGPKTYISCGHRLDPFCLPKPFDPPPGAPWRTAPHFYDLGKLNDYYLAEEVIDWAKQRANFAAFAAVVPHGFRHYMMQPKVVAALWPRLRERLPEEFPDIEAAVRTKYDGLRNDLVETELRTRLQGALPPGVTNTVKDYAAKLKTFLALLEGI